MIAKSAIFGAILGASMMVIAAIMNLSVDLALYLVPFAAAGGFFIGIFYGILFRVR
ncbi:MAG: hypothetical protein UU65_C0002G0172 [candidate division CPR2 bacterium GW2011_GWC1_41_48]|uniref:Uncharacterized protein n=1 Tax=candidate division CPR2 bacterium GW2011_GWC1_41_48 TaxID=1618344 RepID=A0A0G0W8R6_UNCC2|nr:MAG: hypothetical protein UT47_C0002G0132 [candidate division CPR2 bacterium GW2011_GWC2_39_35]KKR27683.1 MAG: hypothetical protein UT60_C0040G0005 [candidate division CPR2 bacterium GW2011_GWD2_39_7]KKS09394.1 MAG: hypothetical protein UU65_C0002G0172 [candidate division CPR2 bacterium GW2011_GWC1_41_48]